MHLENQIEYEYHALELLADSGRTPVPVFVDGSKKELPYGVMVMEFLEGSALDYRKNLMEAAECLADIHSVPVKETDGLISPSNPLQAILDECNQMVQTYYESDLGEEKKKVQIRRLLELGQEKINEIRSELEKTTSSLLDEQSGENNDSIALLKQQYEINHTKYAKDILKRITEV